jgi:uncharacterized membrane protein
MTDDASSEEQRAHAASARASRFDRLGDREKRIARHVSDRTHISRNIGEEFAGGLTFGQRMADHVARFGGSWSFIGLFALVLFIWMALNSFVLLRVGEPFDPYPYILLNLCLSMLAAIQAPLILMSQNRQAKVDRMTAEHDYEVNLKAELEIMELHEKVDALKEGQWNELLAIQHEQLDILKDLVLELKGQRTGK